MIIKKKHLITIFEALSNKEQNTIVTYLLDKTSIKLDVFDFQAKRVLQTNSFKEAFDKAFLQNHRGHFQTTGMVHFYKASPSLISKTITNLFTDLIEHLNYTPNAIFIELRNQRLVHRADRKSTNS